MHSLSRPLLIGIALFAAVMIIVELFHLAGITWEFSQLAGVLVGGSLTIFAARTPIRDEENVEPWLGREQLAWTLIGCGLLMWAFGESFWRYYILTNQSPFPSYADIGYSSLPPLVFIGLLLQPSSGAGRGRWLMLLDSLIAMGSMLTIAWYLLLGSLALASSENVLGKFLGLYYPTTDIALLSCVVLLLLRGQGRLYQATARRTTLLVIGIGLAIFATSDFIFNLQQNANAYVEGTWVDLGWPLGLMTIGVAAYLRRFLPLTSEDMVEQRLRRRAERVTFGPAQLITYALLAIVFVVLVLNVLSLDKAQIAIRPVLLLATVAVVGIVVARQVLTILENERLARRQADSLDRLEMANRRVEEQAQQIAKRNAELELGITHLKDVQARLANGNLRARARLVDGELMPLATSLNLMAERLTRLEQGDNYAQRLRKTINDLTIAIERYRSGSPFIMPQSCNDFPEIGRLLFIIGLRERAEAIRPPANANGPTT